MKSTSLTPQPDLLATAAALACLILLVPTTATAGERTLHDFSSGSAAAKWIAVNDGVMGGISDGRVRGSDDGRLEFFGTVSLENNGGFASIRTRDEWQDLSAFDGLLIRVRGDGQRYACNLRTDFPIMAGSYYQDFTALPNVWQTIYLRFDEFRARSFGVALPLAPALNTRRIRSLGFMISDKQDGPFRLEIEWIKAVGQGAGDVAPDWGPALDDRTAARRLIELAVERGAPLFNAGQPEACSAIYELTARSVVLLAGEEVPAKVVDALQAGLVEVESMGDPAARAWRLRHALDAAHAHLAGETIAR